MRILVMLFCTTVFSFTPENGFSQNTKILIDADVSLTVDEVFDIIKKQSKYTFVFQADLFQNSSKVNLKKGKIKISKLLKKSLNPDQFVFEFTGENTIILMKKDVGKKPSLEELIQEREIKGVVADKYGNPLPGVTIVVKGTNRGVASDIDGKFSILVEDRENNVLVFSFVGMITKEVKVTKQNEYNIVLEDDAKSLAEVVLTGYQTLSRERVTGSFSVISSEEIDSRISTNIVDRLEGLTPGLSLDKDNNIMIRGVSTMYGNSTPLIVIDGFPIDGGISTINPEDIQSLTVLKDAAAASVWGTRAANGVIVITTKQGRMGKGIEVNASYYKTIVMKPSYTDLQMMNTSDRIDMELDFFDNYDTAWGDYYLGLENNRYNALHELNKRLHSSVVPNDLRITETEYQNQINGLRKVNGFQQYEDNLLRNAIKDQVNVSISSNSDNNSFVGSFGYNSDNSTSVGDESTRMVVNLSNRLKLSERVDFNVAANIVYSEQENNGLGTAFFSQYQGLAPYEKILDDNGERVQTYYSNFLFRDAHEEMGLDYGYNPIDEVEANDNTTTGLSTRAQVGLGVKITDDIKFSSKYQYERNYRNTENHMSIENPKWRNIVNDYYVDGEYTMPYGGKFDRYGNETNSWTLRNQIDFSKNFEGEKHKITAIVGNEVRSFSYKSNSSQIMGFDPQLASGLAYDIYGFQNYEHRNRAGSYTFYYQAAFPDVNVTDNRDVSYYTNLSYLFLNKYNFSGSYRLDQANIYGFDKSAKNNALWSTGLSWNLNKESFMDKDWIDRLIVRGTYGVNGNRPNTSITAYLTGVVNGPDFFFGPADKKHINLTNPENAELRSEKVYTTNFGVDYSLFGGKFRGVLEY